MTHKPHDPPSERFWVVETLLDVLGEPEAIVDVIRFFGHGLLLVGRVVFHLLTCHF